MWIKLLSAKSDAVVSIKEIKVTTVKLAGVLDILRLKNIIIPLDQLDEMGVQG
jgi:hypothetical protein